MVTSPQEYLRANPREIDRRASVPATRLCGVAVKLSPRDHAGATRRFVQMRSKTLCHDNILTLLPLTVNKSPNPASPLKTG